VAAIESIKPTTIFGVSTIGGAFIGKSSRPYFNQICHQASLGKPTNRLPELSIILLRARFMGIP